MGYLTLTMLDGKTLTSSSTVVSINWYRGEVAVRFASGHSAVIGGVRCFAVHPDEEEKDV